MAARAAGGERGAALVTPWGADSHLANPTARAGLWQVGCRADELAKLGQFSRGRSQLVLGRRARRRAYFVDLFLTDCCEGIALNRGVSNGAIQLNFLLNQPAKLSDRNRCKCFSCNVLRMFVYGRQTLQHPERAQLKRAIDRQSFQVHAT
jgi:hypothetical protein